MDHRHDRKAPSSGSGLEAFADHSRRRQQFLIYRFTILRDEYEGRDAREAADLMRLYLSAVANGEDEIADTIYGFMSSHAEPVFERNRAWRARH